MNKPSSLTLTMTMSDYLNNHSYGASDLIKMTRSFAYYKYRKENPEPKTRALVIGSAFHVMLESSVTRNDRLLKDILIYSDGSSLTVGFKRFQSENPTKLCLDLEEKKLCDKMLKALLNEPEAMSYIKDAIPEATLIAKYPDTDVMVKCRPDYLHLGRGLSINVKTTNDSSEYGFLAATRDFGYDFQSALYCDILTKEFGRSFDEVHILIEKTDDDEPTPIEIYSFGDDTLAHARSQIWEILQRIPDCEKSGNWPKNKAYLKTLDLPLHFRKVAPL